MTTPAAQEGIARTVGITSELRSGTAIVFIFLACAVVAVGVASVGPSLAVSQEAAVEQSQTEVVDQADTVEQTNDVMTQTSTPVEHAADSDDQTQPAQWRSLLDEQLSQWEVFTGVPHKSVKIEGVPPSESDDCRKGTPVGLGDPKNVYSVTMVDGAPVLHVSGEIYAGLTTLESHKDYHFSTEFKWGEKTWPPRKKTKRDSGILFHCTGKHGAFWNAWMRSIECQIQEGDCGDFISLAGTSCQIRATAETYSKATPQHSEDGKWCSIGTGYGNWGAKRLADHEIPGVWNRIEIHAIGDRAVFSVNGHRVMHLRNARVGKRKHLKPLTGGRIQIQSEASEVWYRDMKIRTIKQLPADMSALYTE